MTKAKRDIYQEVTDTIVNALESGAAPWLKPWTDGVLADATMPYNAITGKNYNGINIMLLWISGTSYTSNAWLTYKQAQSLGGNVIKGQKSTNIIFWQFLKKKNKQGIEETIPMLRNYSVFNVEQCENLNLEKAKIPEVVDLSSTTISDLAKEVGATVKIGGNRAYFRASSDHIGMPELSQFTDANAHDATLAHELVHWTGHKNRLDREMGGRFGSDSYAMEELVAEMGSAFVCARMGIEMTGLQHSEYIASWLKVLKADKRAIFTASSKAKEATEFLLD